LPNESHFLIGGRECVVREGICLLADGSALAGSASRMIDLVRTMVQRVEVPLHQAVKMATENPARALALEKSKGCLRSGADADLVVLSSELEVLRTFVSGEKVFAR
jgi:N-acetylglucosamine-6-phosphate deacetylase